MSWTYTSHFEIDDLRNHPIFADIDPGKADRQPEPPRPGAAGVEEQHAGTAFDQRLVRMAEDHRVTPLGGGVEVQSGDVVAEMELPSGDGDGSCFRQVVGPVVAVDIAADGKQRRDRGQGFEDVAGADVTASPPLAR